MFLHRLNPEHIFECFFEVEAPSEESKGGKFSTQVITYEAQGNQYKDLGVTCSTNAIL